MARLRSRRFHLSALAAALLLLFAMARLVPRGPGPRGRPSTGNGEVVPRAPRPPEGAPAPGEVEARPPGPALPEAKPSADGMVDVTVRVHVAEGSPSLRYATVYILPPDAAGGHEGTIMGRDGTALADGRATLRIPPGPGFLGVVSTRHVPLLRPIEVPPGGMHIEVTLDGGATLRGVLVDEATGEPADIHEILVTSGGGSDEDPHRYPGVASPPGFSREVLLHGEVKGALVIHGLPPGPVRIRPAGGREWRSAGATVSVPAENVRIPMRRNPMVEFRPDPWTGGRFPYAVIRLKSEETGHVLTFTWERGADALVAAVPEGRWTAELRVTGSGSGRVEFELGTEDERRVVPVTLVPMHRVRFTRADGEPLGGYIAIDTPPARGAVRGILGRTFQGRWDPASEQFVELPAGPHGLRWSDGASWAELDFDPASAEAAGGVLLAPVPATVVIARKGESWVEAKDAEGGVVPGILLRSGYGVATTEPHLQAGSAETWCLPPVEGLTLHLSEDDRRIPLVPGTRNEIDLPEE